MTLESSNTTVGILYDIENAPFEMLNYTLGKARRFQPCRTIVISDWEERPEQKRWEKLLRRPGFTFRQISRTFLGKNSLDSALYDSAKLLYEEGVRRYFIITTDSDFVRIAQMLNSKEKSYIIGVGTKQASETLRNAYDEFIVYPAEEKETVRKKHTRKNAETAEEALEKAEPKANKKAEPQAAAAEKPEQASHVNHAAAAPSAAPAAKPEHKAKATALPEGTFAVRLPKTLRKQLEARMQEEEVTMDELITYLLMRGLSH